MLVVQDFCTLNVKKTDTTKSPLWPWGIVILRDQVSRNMERSAILVLPAVKCVREGIAGEHQEAKRTCLNTCLGASASLSVGAEGTDEDLA